MGVSCRNNFFTALPSSWLVGHSLAALCPPLTLRSSSNALPGWVPYLLQLLPKHAVEALAKQLRVLGKRKCVQAISCLTCETQREAPVYLKKDARKNIWADRRLLRRLSSCSLLYLRLGGRRCLDKRLGCSRQLCKPRTGHVD